MEWPHPGAAHGWGLQLGQRVPSCGWPAVTQTLSHGVPWSSPCPPGHQVLGSTSAYLPVGPCGTLAVCPDQHLPRAAQPGLLGLGSLGACAGLSVSAPLPWKVWPALRARYSPGSQLPWVDTVPVAMVKRRAGSLRPGCLVAWHCPGPGDLCEHPSCSAAGRGPQHAQCCLSHYLGHK